MKCKYNFNLCISESLNFANFRIIQFFEVGSHFAHFFKPFLDNFKSLLPSGATYEKQAFLSNLEKRLTYTRQLCRLTNSLKNPSKTQARIVLKTCK